LRYPRARTSTHGFLDTTSVTFDAGPFTFLTPPVLYH
jgi:hypothetical protein